MPRCATVKPNGTPCERIVGASQDYCFAHNPAHVEDRRRGASKAAKSESGKEIVEAKRLLDKIVEGVLAGALDRGGGAVEVQAINAKRGLLEIERKIKEQEEFGARIVELEASLL